MDLKLNLIHHNWVVVTVQGRVDSFNYNDVSSKIQTLLRMGKTHIAMDFSEVSYLNIAFLRFLNRMSHQLFEVNGHLAFVNASDYIKERISPFVSSHKCIYIGELYELQRISKEADRNP